MKKKVNSESTLSDCIGILRSEFKAHRFLTVSISTGKARTLSQNRISHVWYTQVAKELREETESEVKCRCKLHIGIDILRGAEDGEHFNMLCERIIDPLSYEDKLLAMEVFDVTSEFNTEQFSRYLEAVQKNYSLRGVTLEFPEDN